MQPNPFDTQPIRSSTAAYNKRDQEELKNALTDRLYDKGVSNKKLPGISHRNTEHLRPFTARLTSRLEQRGLRSGTNSQGKFDVLPQLGSPEFRPPAHFGELPGTSEGRDRPLHTAGIPRPNTIQGQRETKKQRKPGTARIVKSITGVTVTFFPNGW